MTANTIIGFPMKPSNGLRSMLFGRSELMPLPYEEDESQRLFRIRAASTQGQRSSASVLVKRMYESRGYETTSQSIDAPAESITLLASDNDATIGTMTIGFDSDRGLLVDDLFPDETDALRRQGRQICEFTKLAMDSVVRSKRLLASLFHVAYIFGHRIKGCHNLLIEVNPRHVAYYEKMLGFEVTGPERLNRRVNAPAVMLSLDFEHAQAQIDKFGGKAELAASERSLYPYFFSIAEEAGIVSRL